jgi:hypothetical protein
MRFTLRIVFVLLLISASCALLQAQRRIIGSVCGDPTAKCRLASDFQPFELAFDHGGPNSIIAESKPFYAVILRSVKLPEDQSGCDNKFPEAERLEAQALFPKNKVFAKRCDEPAQNFYTNVADNTTFLGVYAGLTLTQANAFLKKVEATGKFPGAVIRRMKVGINGT